MIVATNLIKSYNRKKVLCGLSLQASPGEITMLVGANGAGKSTTMKVLAGLAAADGGTAFVAGHDVRRARRQAQRALSYLPQNPDFHPRLTSLQVLEFYRSLRGGNRERVSIVLEQLGLTNIADERTETLSGGLRQRLGIALLLLPDAPVLLLDEPGLSLDPGWRNRLREILNDEAARGKTVLMATHLIAEWNGVAHRCLLCHEGRIERELDPNDLPNDFDDFGECVSPALRSGRRGGPGFGARVETVFARTPTKVRDGEAPSPAREARALAR